MFCDQAQLERKRWVEASNLRAPAELGDDLIIQLLIDRGIDIATKSQYGKTALYIAAMTGNVECTRLLLDAGADPEVKDTQGNSTLHDAVRLGQTGVVQLLIQRGAELQSQNS